MALLFWACCSGGLLQKQLAEHRSHRVIRALHMYSTMPPPRCTTLLSCEHAWDSLSACSYAKACMQNNGRLHKGPLGLRLLLLSSQSGTGTLRAALLLLSSKACRGVVHGI